MPNTGIEKSVRFIDGHLSEEISVKQLAAIAGYSISHFCHLFHAHQGMPPMEYIRKARLTAAARRLLLGESVTLLALDYGFETPGGFSKAFRREFGYSPLFYQKRMRLLAESQQQTGGTTMNPVIQTIPGFLVAGYGIQTNIAGARYAKDVASFWEYYDGENLESRLYDILKPSAHGEYGFCIPTSETGDALYLLGVAIDRFQDVPADMKTLAVPQGEYVIFSTPPVDTRNDPSQKQFAAVIRDTWKSIFEEWFPQSAYEFDETRPDYEYYDERCHFCADTVMEIRIPIRRRSE